MPVRYPCQSETPCKSEKPCSETEHSLSSLLGGFEASSVCSWWCLLLYCSAQKDGSCAVHSYPLAVSRCSPLKAKRGRTLESAHVTKPCSLPGIPHAIAAGIVARPNQSRSCVTRLACWRLWTQNTFARSN